MAKKAKKIIISTLIILSILLCIGFTYYKSGTVFNKLDISIKDITKIELEHGDNGKTVAIDNQEDLSKVISYLRGFTCQNSLSSSVGPYWIAIKFYHNDTVIGDCTLFNNDNYILIQNKKYSLNSKLPKREKLEIYFEQ